MSAPTKVPTPTHGFSVESSTNGVARTIKVARLDDHSFGVVLLTDWGNGQPLVETQMRLQPEALDLLIEALQEAACNMDSYKMKEPA